MLKLFQRVIGSFDRQFVAATLARQLEIAKQIRALDDKTRILYSPCFVPTSVARIGDHTVSIDDRGRQAILSAAAQKLFPPDYYGRFVKDPEVIRVGDSFYLPASDLAAASFLDSTIRSPSSPEPPLQFSPPCKEI